MFEKALPCLQFGQVFLTTVILPFCALWLWLPALALLSILVLPIILEEKDPSELAENIEGLNVKNPYFEITPAYLINGIVTEMGLMDSNKLESVIDSMSEYIRSLY